TQSCLDNRQGLRTCNTRRRDTDGTAAETRATHRLAPHRRSPLEKSSAALDQEHTIAHLTCDGNYARISLRSRRHPHRQRLPARLRLLNHLDEVGVRRGYS